MPTVRIRLTGTDDATNQMMSMLHGIDGIEHVEEVGDLMPHMDDEDSSSAGLHDVRHLHLHEIEVEAPDNRTADRVRNAAELLAVNLQVTIELVDEF